MEPVRLGLGLQKLGLLALELQELVRRELVRLELVRLELGLLERVSPVEVHDDDEGEVEDDEVAVEVVVLDPPLLHLLQPLQLPRVQHDS